MRGIDGWFSEDEGRWYARFARALHGGVFVEVGSWKGRSTSFIGRICNANATRLVCVDHWQGSHDVLAPRYAAALETETSGLLLPPESSSQSHSPFGVLMSSVVSSSLRAEMCSSPLPVKRTL